MRTISRSSRARFRASASLLPVWRCTVSAIWWPMVKTGSNAVAGSWKIMATLWPRRSPRAREPMSSTSSPSTRMLPDQRVRCSGWSRRIERRVTLLPEPDSPRMPSVSPRLRSKLTPFTACTVRSGVTKVTWRSRTSRRLLMSGRRLRMAGARHPHVAGDRLPAGLGERRLDPGANVFGEGTARAEAATRRRIDRIGRIALDRRLMGALARIHRWPGREQRSRIGMLRVAVDRLDGAQLDDLAEIHHHHTVAEILHDIEVVADEEVGEAELGLEIDQHVQHLRLDRLVERRHRLVEDDQTWPERQGARDVDALALAARQLVRIALCIGVGLEPDLG